MAWLMHIDYRRLRKPAVVYALLGAVLVLLVAVLFSPQLNATRRGSSSPGSRSSPRSWRSWRSIPFLAYQIEKKQERVNELSFLAAGRPSSPC